MLWSCMYMHAYTHTHTPTYTHTHTYLVTYMHTHTYTQAPIHSNTLFQFFSITIHTEQCSIFYHPTQNYLLTLSPKESKSMKHTELRGEGGRRRGGGGGGGLFIPAAGQLYLWEGFALTILHAATLKYQAANQKAISAKYSALTPCLPVLADPTMPGAQQGSH